MSARLPERKHLHVVRVSDEHDSTLRAEVTAGAHERRLGTLLLLASLPSVAHGAAGLSRLDLNNPESYVHALIPFAFVLPGTIGSIFGIHQLAGGISRVRTANMILEYKDWLRKTQEASPQ